MNDYTQDLIKHSNKLQELSDKYSEERMNYGKCEGDLMILLATKIQGYMAKKKNIGMEMALLQLISEGGDEIKGKYHEMKSSYHNYKALGKLIEAQSSAIMTIQSIMKWNVQGERKE